MYARRSPLAAVVLSALCVFPALAHSQVIGHPAERKQATSTPANFVRMATAIDDDYFDGHDTAERIQRHLRTAKALGVRYLRCAFSWNGIEPERGKYDFQFWDGLVDESTRAGITLIPYVAYTPKWAATKEDDFWKQPPRDPSDFANIMRTLAQRYRGKVTDWELWNEPDNKEYWNGTPGSFAQMVIGAAKAIHEVAPEDVLVLGGMTHGTSEFLDVLISKYHVEQHVDVLALHAYPESWNEERAETTFTASIEQMHEVAAKSGKLLWLNEMGYADYRYEPNHASIYGTNIFYSYEHTARYQAEFLFKSFLLTLASGEVDLAGWYRIDDFREDDPRMPQDKVNHHLGVIDTSGKPKPAFFAFRFFNSLFNQPTLTLPLSPRKAPSQAVIRILQRKDKLVIVAGWLRSSTYGEVKIHSGRLADTRRESVDVPLPCTAARASTFNVLGHRLATTRPKRSVLRQVPLRGDRIYLAEITCAAPAR